ncbi:MAG: UDP-N-acetylglucosamine 1-carboxyvinyltransferase, partial [Bacteroidia bacterium]|nr:UDP-N-acetylglucosamine 1-carboxyvinyltransferase [Bacteroidia bacterium]
MSIFRIRGGNKLKGEIVPQGAKNEALQILSATLLTQEAVTISNIPDIRDVNKLIELIGDLGCVVTRIDASTYRFEAKNIDIEFLQSSEYREKAAALRGSVMLLGPIL